MRQYSIEQSKDLRIEELSKLLMLHIENTDSRFLEHEEKINLIIQALNNLIEQPPETKKIGFKINDTKKD
jgi:predicted Zn-ribbon and HTH transcriptional regulator